MNYSFYILYAMKDALISSRQWVYGLIACLCLFACRKEEQTPTIIVTGKVELVDEFGIPPTAISGIRIDGIQVTATTSTASYTTTTQANGTYSLCTVAGVQTLTFAKEYVGTYKLLEQSITAAQELPVVHLGVQVLRGVGAVTLTKGADALYIEGVMNQENRAGLPPTKHRLFFRNGPVSATNYALTVAGETNVGTDQFFEVIPYTQLRAAGLLPDTQITLIAYGDNSFADTYMDPVTRLVIYPAVNETGSNYVSFSY